MRACLALLIVVGLQMSPLPAADKKDAPKPLPPEIVQAWRDAGANVGWMKWEENGAPKGTKFHAQEQGEIKAMPVFQFSAWKEGVLVKLPDPDVPFGLSLNLTKNTDAGVTEAGLKELAGLKNLHALYLRNTAVTDAGLKELAGLKSLQSLIMWGTKATPAGVAELRKELPKCNIADQ